MQVVWSIQLEGIANAVNRLGKAHPNRAVRLPAATAYRRLLQAAHCHLAGKGQEGCIRNASVPNSFEEAYALIRAASRQFESEWSASSYKISVDTFLSYLGEALIAILEASRVVAASDESGFAPPPKRGRVRKSEVILCTTPEEIFDNLVQRGILQP